MGKLVRDFIPDIIRMAGTEPTIRILDEQEYAQALRAKLHEEATELGQAAEQEVVGEIADVLEVLRAIAELHGLSWSDVESAAATKRAERGGFTARVFLEM